MIPYTTLGLIVSLAALGPGYLYIRAAEVRSPRPERSGLVEAVELVVIGAFASTLSLIIVVLVAGWANAVNAHSLLVTPTLYFHHHAFAVVELLGLALIAAYLLAYVGARTVHRRQTASLRPGVTSWSGDCSGGW